MSKKQLTEIARNIPKERVKEMEDFVFSLIGSELDFVYILTKDMHEFYEKSKRSEQMQRFSIGQKVEFSNGYGDVLSGKIIKINQKSLTIATKEDGEWRVSPSKIF